MDYEKLFDESYSRVIENPVARQDFFAVFYQHFFDQSDEIKSLFSNTNLEKQAAMLKKSFYSLLAFYATNNADHVLEDMAASHSKEHHGIKPALYDNWLESLVYAAGECDPGFNPDIELAWRLVMTPGITFMKFHY